MRILSKMLIVVLKKSLANGAYSLLGPIHSVAITPDSKLIVSGSEDRSIRIFDIETFQQLYCFKDAHEGQKKCTMIKLNSFFQVQLLR